MKKKNPQRQFHRAIVTHFYFFRYKWLDKTFVGTGTKIVVKKMLIDQFIMTPPFYVVFFVGEFNILLQVIQKCNEYKKKTINANIIVNSYESTRR